MQISTYSTPFSRPPHTHCIMGLVSGLSQLLLDTRPLFLNSLAPSTCLTSPSNPTLGQPATLATSCTSIRRSSSRAEAAAESSPAVAASAPAIDAS